MKPRSAALAVALVIIVASVALYAAYPRITSTSIARITADLSSFNGREVNIFGTIIEREEDGFTLADGTGTMEVDWVGALPPVGTQRVFVHGFVRTERLGDAKLSATSLGIWPV